MKRFYSNHKILALLATCSLFVTTLTACSESSSVSGTVSTSAPETVAASSSITSDEAFTDKDLETGYDETESDTITLTGSTALTNSSSVQIDGSVITIKSKGTYVLTGTLNDGYIVVDAGNSDDIRLILKNASVTSSDYAALYCLNADNVYITLDDNTQNVLANTGEFDSKDNNKVDGAIFSKTDLTINGSGSLEVISTKHGIVGKDDIMVTGGSLTVTGEKDGIQANDSVSVQNATIDITCGKDGIQADNDDDLTKGYIYISSGNVTINAGDDGITAATTLQIDDGTINITNSYEGIEAQNITINGGNISVFSSDDGLNAVSATSSGESMQADSSTTLVINGGNIYIRSEGDGVDSNGSFEMSGGTLTVMGPTRGGNGSLDVNGSAVITGGTVVMAGTSDMATNFTQASQGSVLIVTGSQAEGSEISITDDSGNEIISVTSDCSYRSVLISSPDLRAGNSYILAAGNYKESFTLEDNIYGSGSGFGRGETGGMPQDDARGGMSSGNPGDLPGGDRGPMPH